MRAARVALVALVLLAARALVVVAAAEETRACAATADDDAAADGRASCSPTDSHGWKRYDSPMDGPCTIDRVDAAEMSFATFTSTYKDRKPVVLTGMRARNAAFRELCAKDALLSRWGDANVTLSTANTHSYEKTAEPLRTYVRTRLAPQRPNSRGDATLYWFGDHDHEMWAPHFDAYVRPPFVPNAADVARSFGVGGPHSGVPLHVHGPGFSESVVGRKRWWLSPPKPKPRFDPNATALEWALGLGEDRRVPAADDDGAWVNVPERYATKETAAATHATMLECTVREGEAVYFPDQWWHATLNLDETVFMSSFVNYALDGSVGADELDDTPLGATGAGGAR
jgi:hypothetical protein